MDETVENNLGTPTAASKSVIDNDSSRTPAAIAESRSATDTTAAPLKEPGLQEVWEEDRYLSRDGGRPATPADIAAIDII